LYLLVVRCTGSWYLKEIWPSRLEGDDKVKERYGSFKKHDELETDLKTGLEHWLPVMMKQMKRTAVDKLTQYVVTTLAMYSSGRW
jgi:hypothetical protein